MILTSVEITDFLSIKGTTKLIVDKAITVLLGSNDHGKSNLLKAIEHLNEDRPIVADDVNWDAAGTASLEFSFRLTGSEKQNWLMLVKNLNAELKELEEKRAEENTNNSAEEVEDGQEEETEEEGEEEEQEEGQQETEDGESDNREATLRQFLMVIPDDDQSETQVVSRRGVNTGLSFKGIDFKNLPIEIANFFSSAIPRVELIRSLTGELQDSVSVSDLNTEGFEFMQGLFYYAGLNPADAGPLFEQDDRTERQIQNASKMLDENLRRLWGQGTQLHFCLGHRKGKIEFLADDPAVKNRKARMSKRSDGVTQFFRTSIVLHARRKKHEANSYIYLFDEPGVYLHPQGQKDLMQVFEQLGSESQILYATHSLFMLNQNFPERHRLVIKDDEGTKIDGKPHRANWRLATDALGVFLTSNILFSSYILFVEGDSDPLYIYEFFRQLNRFGELDADINRLGIMSFSDVQNLKFLLQVIKRDDNNIRSMVLFDGDAAGAQMSERVKALCERLQVKRHQLEGGKSIEDYCFHEQTFIAAVTKTLRDAKDASGDKSKLPGDFDTKVKSAWDERKKPAEQPEPKEESRTDGKGDKKQEKVATLTAGKWFEDTAKSLIDDDASKVALARNYILACREVEDSVLKQAGHVALKKLCQHIADELALPKIASDQAMQAAKQ